MAFFGICLRNNDVVRGAIAVGDPVFGAVEQVIVAHIDGRRSLRSGIRTCLGLGKTKSPDHFSRSQLGQVFLLLVLRTVFFNSPAHQRVIDGHHD